MRLGLGRRLPTTRGHLSVEGISRRVEIRRDAHGIPFVEAATDEDAWFGLGFCHAQDRSFQLEILQRVARGTLSALIGPEGLAVDRLSRRIGFRRAAEAQIALCAGDVQAQLSAYARGINAGRERGGPRCHELVILGAQPTPWDAVDAQALSAFLCFALAANWDAELVRLKILQEDGVEALMALDPAYAEHLPVSYPPDVPAGPSADGLARDIARFGAALGGVAATGGGSNAWAVAGSKTASGRPILANDPHLQPTQPGQWYLVRMSTPGWTTVGATFVGIPAICAGHNGTAAWGVTAGHADNTDLFLEEIGPDRRSVRQGDRFVPCEVRHEVIEVKGQAEVVEEILMTPRGPVVGPALAGHPDAISLAATWARPAPYRGLYSVHRVRSLAELRQLFEDGCLVSAASLVYADRETIGWQLAMDVPRRKSGAGHLPIPGWQEDEGWEDELVPFDQMPWCEDPAAGFVATANNQPVPTGEGPFLGVDWLDGYRAAAIVEALSARDDWDRDATMRLQLDQRCIPWREMRERVLSLSPSDPDAREALQLLAAWDGCVDAGSSAAAVYELFVASMCQRVVRAKAPRAAAYALGHGINDLLSHNLMFTRRVRHLVGLLREEPAGFFAEPWSAVIEGALADSVRTLRLRHGSDRRGWAWGQVRPLTLEHPFGAKKPLDRIFNVGPMPFGGDAGTIPQASVDMMRPTANPIGVPTLRLTIDVGAWDASRFILSGGQSGNPFSPHYADQTPLWARGEGVPIPWSRTQLESRTLDRLVLAPEV